ncbi:DinB family protein [Cytobacillus firmus]|uniref:DinB family protein n=1 Tax=Cytobacillus firmus TaxID=1399 RepID=UPI0022283DCC|nr:DinB family protein [Cytobacillus firmus]
MIEYRIKHVKGYDEKIGELVSMLEHAREVTLEEISGLKKAELDFLPDPGSNSIGSLLKHIGFIEYVHQIITFENRDLNDEEHSRWAAAYELGEKARNEINDHPLEFYLEELSAIRGKTLKFLASKKDCWLYEEGKWSNGVTFNNYWFWYHVMEDEISHRGQIRVIKRQLATQR